MSEGASPEAPGLGEAEPSADKHSRARRRLLKAVAAGGGAVAATQVVPARWVKPVLDTLVVPAHAQASGLTMTAQITLQPSDDSITPPQQTFNGPGSFTMAGTYVGTFIGVIGQATLVPPVAQNVTLTLVKNSGPGNVSGSPVNAPAIAGVASLAGISFASADNTTIFNATFSSAGVPNQVLTLHF